MYEDDWSHRFLCLEIAKLEDGSSLQSYYLSSLFYFKNLSDTWTTLGL